MRGVAGRPGWFWLFLLEGLLTVLIGVVSLLFLPSSPTATKSILCPKPWYTEREEVIMINVRSLFLHLLACVLILIAYPPR